VDLRVVPRSETRSDLQDAKRMKKCWRGKEKAMFDYSKNGSTCILEVLLNICNSNKLMANLPTSADPAH
jgi:hypothetical protein